MLSALAVITFVASAARAQGDDYYNILSFDGGGIRGLISAQVVKFMEVYAHNYSRDTYCVPESESD